MKFLNNFPHLIEQWDYEFNIGINPNEIKYGSGKHYGWKCYKGHRWTAAPCERCRKNRPSGCPYCNGKKVCPDNCLDNFPEIAKEFHPVKNGDKKSSDFASKSGKKVWWLGFKCNHEWESTIANRTSNNQGCPYCTNKKACPENCLDNFPEIAKEFHPTKNGDKKTSEIIQGSDSKVWWLCSKCNREWKMFVYSRTSSNQGCPYCVNRKVCSDNCLDNFPEIAKEFHPTKNENLHSFDIISGSSKIIWWLCCKCGHEWKCRIYSRTLLETGCPSCRKSKGEEVVHNFLKINNVNFQLEYKLGYRAWVDFYLPEINTIIEYQGKQHYIPCDFGSKEKDADIKNLISNVERDIKKELYCKENNIKLIKIPYWEQKNLERILDYIIRRKEYEFSEPPEIVKKHENKVKLITERFCRKLDMGLIKV